MPQSPQSEQQEMVRETVKSLMVELGPVFRGMQISPEKLAEAFKEANKPYEDPAKIASELRQRQKTRKDFLEARAMTEARQKACPHKDKNDKNALNLQHNFPDNMPRGLCPMCLVVIEPAHWDVRADGTTFIVPENPLYNMVRQKEAVS